MNSDKYMKFQSNKIRDLTFLSILLVSFLTTSVSKLKSKGLSLANKHLVSIWELSNHLILLNQRIISWNFI